MVYWKHNIFLLPMNAAPVDTLDHADLSLFNRESVGSIMTNAVPTADDQATIGDVEQHLLGRINDFRSINYTYILDASEKLVGILSIKELFRQPKQSKVRDVMRDASVTVHPHHGRERAARLALEHSIKAVPVVREDGVFLGVILNDAILTILQHEANKNLFGLAGIHHTDAITNTEEAGVFEHFKHRLPWLLVGIVGSLLAAGFINRFEKTLESNLLLAAFIPLVVYISSAVAEQTQAFAIRDMDTHPMLRFRPYFTRQFSITLIIASVIAILLFGVGVFLYDSPFLGTVLAVSNFLAILTSVITGFVLPYIAEKWYGIDPANAGGPIATVIQDVMGVLIYLSVALWFM